MASPVPPTDGTFGPLADEISRSHRRLDDVERIGGAQFSDLPRRVSDLETARANITATQGFLLSQTAFASSATFISETNQPGTAVHAWDGTYDLAITLDSSSTGVLWITVGALFAVNGLGTPWLGIEVLEGATQVVAPDRYANGAGMGSSVGSQILSANAQRSIMATVTPNTTVTIRTRRGRNNNTPTSTGTIAIEGQTLSVTKVGV